MKSKFLKYLFTVTLLALSSFAFADDWVSPQEKNITSPNGEWHVRIIPAKKWEELAQATLRYKQKPARMFALRSHWMPVDIVLLDDGTLVTFDEWHRLGYGEVVVAHNPDGQVRWSQTLEALVGKERMLAFSHSVSSIWWRILPLEWSLQETGTSLIIRLQDEHQLKIRLSDGHATPISVDKLPDDPVRLANRAQALRQLGQIDEAIVLLQRACKLKPDDLPLHMSLVEALQQLNKHKQAIRVGNDAARQFKKTENADTNLANLYVLVARSQIVLKLYANAETSFRLGIAAAPGYDYPALELSNFLVKQGRSKDADKVLSDLVKHTAGQTNVDFLLLQVGDFYRQRKQPAVARDYYLKAFRTDRVTNQFLYQALAEVYEELGDPKQALAIYQLLSKYFETMGPAFKENLSQTQKAMQRLDGNH